MNGNISSCIIPYQTLPYSGQTITAVSPYLTEPVYPFKLRKVENGFIVINQGKEHVFNTLEGLVNFIKQTYKEGK